MNNNRFQNKEKIKVFIKKQIFKNESLIWLLFMKLKSFFKGVFYFAYEILSETSIYLKLFKIKGIKSKKEVLIIAGGPSSNKLNLKDLLKFQKNNDIIFVNNFFLNKNFKKVIPNYQVISDLATINVKVNKKQWVPSKKKISYVKKFRKFILNNKNIKIFAPIIQVKEILKLTSPENIFGFCDSDLSYIYSAAVPILPRGYISNTTYKAISIASWMGYKKQYIIGLDNTFINNLITSSNNEIFLLEKHNYGRDVLFDYTKCYGDFSDIVYHEARLLGHLKRLTKNKKIYSLNHLSYTPGLKKIRTKKFKLD